MSVITDLQTRVTDFNNELESGLIVKRIIEDNEAYIVDLNAQEQLYEKGVNALGVSISDYQHYSPITIQIKRMKGQPTNRVTLRDEGDFHSSFYVQADNEMFFISAHDEKTGDLIRRYGRQIFGLTPENMKELIWEIIYPDLLQKAKSKII